MREDDRRPPAPVVAGPDSEVAPAPMDLTVGEAILEAAELNSGVPDQRATEGAAARPGPDEGGPARAAEPVCRDDHGRAAAGRTGVAGEVVRCHG